MKSGVNAFLGALGAFALVLWVLVVCPLLALWKMFDIFIWVMR